MRIERIEVDGETLEISIPETVGEYFELQREREENCPDSMFS